MYDAYPAWARMHGMGKCAHVGPGVDPGPTLQEAGRIPDNEQLQAMRLVHAPLQLGAAGPCTPYCPHPLKKVCSQ